MERIKVCVCVIENDRKIGVKVGEAFLFSIENAVCHS